MTAKERRWDLFVWDWDGTIMDTTGLIALGLQQAVEKLGLTPVTFEKAKSTIGLGFFETMQVIAFSRLIRTGTLCAKPMSYCFLIFLNF